MACGIFFHVTHSCLSHTLQRTMSEPAHNQMVKGCGTETHKANSMRARKTLGVGQPRVLVPLIRQGGNLAGSRTRALWEAGSACGVPGVTAWRSTNKTALC